MGGGKSPSIQDPPELEPAPSFEQQKEPISKAIREAGTKQFRARRGHAGNILTDPLGIEGINKLGRSFFV